MEQKELRSERKDSPEPSSFWSGVGEELEDARPHSATTHELNDLVGQLNCPSPASCIREVGTVPFLQECFED